MAATINAVPPRTLHQRKTALARANEIRSARATLKKDMKAGRVTGYGVIACPPELTHTMKVYDLLLAMPKYGRTKADRALKRANVSPSKTLAGLSDRQRTELLGLLR